MSFLSDAKQGVEDLFNPNKMKKLQIRAISPMGALESLGLAFTAQFNPSSMTRTLVNKIDGRPPLEGRGSKGAFIYGPAEELSFDLVLDDTPVSQSSKATLPIIGEVSLDTQITLFQRIAYRIDGETHAPNDLELNWGTMVFLGHLKSANIKYTAFLPGGKPIRAELSLSFLAYSLDPLLSFIKASPDVTHTRRVAEGDTLMSLCQQVYGDTSMYVAVARVNKLESLSKLQVGQQLSFPPIQPASATA